MRRGRPGYRGSYAAAMQQISYVGGQLHRTVAQFEPVEQPELIPEDDVQEAGRRQVFYGEPAAAGGQEVLLAAARTKDPPRDGTMNIYKDGGWRSTTKEEENARENLPNTSWHKICEKVCMLVDEWTHGGMAKWDESLHVVVELQRKDFPIEAPRSRNPRDRFRRVVSTMRSSHQNSS